MSAMPGKGFFGWFGRQIGYVRSALQSDSQRVYRNETVEEKSLPGNPSVKLRRTIIDEAIRMEQQMNADKRT